MKLSSSHCRNAAVSLASPAGTGAAIAPAVICPSAARMSGQASTAERTSASTAVSRLTMAVPRSSPTSPASSICIIDSPMPAPSGAADNRRAPDRTTFRAGWMTRRTSRPIPAKAAVTLASRNRMSSLMICTTLRSVGQAPFAPGGSTRIFGLPGSRSAPKCHSERAAADRSAGSCETTSAGGMWR